MTDRDSRTTEEVAREFLSKKNSCRRETPERLDARAQFVILDHANRENDWRTGHIGNRRALACVFPHNTRRASFAPKPGPGRRLSIATPVRRHGPERHSYSRVSRAIEAERASTRPHDAFAGGASPANAIHPKRERFREARGEDVRVRARARATRHREHARTRGRLAFSSTAPATR